jgi:MoaA/NifB/PqqE/SkfB family radical SAM enzyme
MMDSPVDPVAISIEATSVCQLRCPSCPTASGATRPVLGRGYLDVTQFENFLGANPQIGRAELSNYGEMFLHPDLPELLKCALRLGVVLTGDNGANLNNAKEEVLSAIVEFRLGSLSVSIDGASNATYSKYRVGGNFDRVIENIRRINHYKKQFASAFPRLRWQFIAFGHNQHEIASARKLAEELGMSFFVKLAWGKFSPVTDEAEIRQATGLDAATREQFRRRYNVDYTDEICHQLWQRPQINWDGKMLGCCRNFWGDFGGNVFEERLGAIVNAEKIRYARAMLNGQSPPREDIPCTTCEIYLDRKKSGRWIEKGRG